MCVVGGVLFTLTYLHTRFLLATSIEHALNNCFLFTVGWCQYLYSGRIGR